MNDPGPRSLPPSYFDDLYRANDDPWDFETSAYEAGKYAATLAALPRARYRAALEIGCSIGVLTRRLAERCEALLAIDVAEQALGRARERCGHLGHVRFERMHFPHERPNGRFDLTLLSEVGYYWSPDDLMLARRRLIERLEPGGHLLLVHWTPKVADYPLTGDQVHAAFLEYVGSEMRHLETRREERYRLDLFERV